MKTFSLNNLPPVTDEEINKAVNFKNSDFSDCPRQNSEDLKQFKPLKEINPEMYKHLKSMYKPVKKEIHMRIDADVLEWIKSQGRGYQTRINQILRQAMLSDVSQR